VARAAAFDAEPEPRLAGALRRLVAAMS
jgi:hypothetical protein